MNNKYKILTAFFAVICIISGLLLIASMTNEYVRDREMQELHLPKRKSESQRMRALDGGMPIPSLAHRYASELFCRALCSEAI